MGYRRVLQLIWNGCTYTGCRAGDSFSKLKSRKLNKQERVCTRSTILWVFAVVVIRYHKIGHGDAWQPIIIINNQLYIVLLLFLGKF